MPSARSRAAAIGLSVSLLVTGLVAPMAPEAAAAPLPNFQDTVVLSGLRNPTSVEFAADGRIFVAEKSGLIKVFPALGAAGTIFADLRTDVYNYWDRGLLGMALHPNFPATPWIYALYTRDALPGGSSPHWNDACPSPPSPNADGCVATGRLVRLTAAGNVATGSPNVLITDWCQQFPSHSIADIGFGPDGMLYASGGDGASFTGVDYGQRGGLQPDTPTPVNPCGDPANEGGALRAQDLVTDGDAAGLSGSVIRIHPDTGAAAAGNPLITHPDLNARRVVAYGMRNPFRFTFRPGTDELWIGDVGWSSREEINRITNLGGPAENFGWPCFEGVGPNQNYDNTDLSLCESLYAAPSAVTRPWFSYLHSGTVGTVPPADSCPFGSSSISGLAFYEGGSFPDTYDGALFFSDYSRNCIWAAMPTGAGGLPSTTNIQTFVAEADSPIELDIGPGGDLYYVSFGDATGAAADGSVRRIHYAPGNQLPSAEATASPSAGPLPLSVNFNGSGSSDPDPGDLLTYAWDLDNDGAFDDATGVTASRTFSSAGIFTVRLRVTDSSGGAATDSVSITAGNSPPIPVISAPTASSTWAVDQAITVAGSADDGEGHALPASSLTWSLVIHHCPSNCHPHAVDSWSAAVRNSFVAPDHEYPSHLELILTATDPGGLSGSTSVLLQPRTVNLSFTSSPSGAELSVGTVSDTAPFVQTAIVGSSLNVIAPDQALGGAPHEFVSWSDGGTQEHDIVVPATNRTYTATFAEDRNQAPAFSPPPPDVEGWEGKALRVVVHATDPDGDDVTYAATGLPSGITLDPATGVIAGIRGSSGSGSFLVNVTASDGEGGARTARFTITVHDAQFSARKATFRCCKHTGYRFAADGTVTGERGGTLAGNSSALVDGRREWNGRPYLHVANGMWGGWWVPESSAIHLPGAVGHVTFTTSRRAAFVAGTHVGYLLSSAGSLSSGKSATLARNSGASSNARAVVNGLPYLRIVNGIWAGRWVAEHYLAIGPGTHRAYDIEAGATAAAFTYRLPKASGASMVARVAGPGGWYLAVSNGVFAEHWLRESFSVRRRVALED